MCVCVSLPFVVFEIRTYEAETGPAWCVFPDWMHASSGVGWGGVGLG